MALLIYSVIATRFDSKCRFSSGRMPRFHIEELHFVSLSEQVTCIPSIASALLQVNIRGLRIPKTEGSDDA